MMIYSKLSELSDPQLVEMVNIGVAEIARRLQIPMLAVIMTFAEGQMENLGLTGGLVSESEDIDSWLDALDSPAEPDWRPEA